LQWVPRGLTTAQKARPVERSIKLPQLIKSVRHNDPTLLVTLVSAGSTFAKTSNDSGFPAANPLPIGPEAWGYRQK
jgi:hypothetical protein